MDVMGSKPQGVVQRLEDLAVVLIKLDGEGG